VAEGRVGYTLSFPSRVPREMNEERGTDAGGHSNGCPVLGTASAQLDLDWGE